MGRPPKPAKITAKEIYEILGGLVGWARYYELATRAAQTLADDNEVPKSLSEQTAEIGRLFHRISVTMKKDLKTVREEKLRFFLVTSHPKLTDIFEQVRRKKVTFDESRELIADQLEPDWKLSPYPVTRDQLKQLALDSAGIKGRKGKLGPALAADQQLEKLTRMIAPEKPIGRKTIEKLRKKPARFAQLRILPPVPGQCVLCGSHLSMEDAIKPPRSD